MSDHTLLPATHTCIHKWNESYLPLLPSRRALLHLVRYSFPILLRKGGRVGLDGWLHAKTVCPGTVTHLSTKCAWRRVTSLIQHQITT